MKNIALIVAVNLLIGVQLFAQKVENFELTDVIGGRTFELSAQLNAKAVVLVFTSLSCPFSKLYEDRIIALQAEYGGSGFVFALVNPQMGQDQDESVAAVKQRAAAKKFSFPFLDDSNQSLTRQLQITKLPEVVVITPSPTGSSIAYRGAIDNNPQLAENANIKYLANALEAIQNKKNPSPSSTRAVGCNVRVRN